MTSKERVAIVKVVEQRIDDAVAQLVGLLGDLEAIVSSGSRVMIKPNLVFPPTDRGVTHTELIEAVVRLVATTSPKEILIAEGSADVYTSQGFRFKDLGRVAARYGARLVDLNLEPGVKTLVPEGLGREYVMVPQADAIYMTRVQDEWDEEGKESEKVDISRYCFTAAHLDVLKADAILMHPLPRRAEISTDVDSDPRAMYWRQMRNGMWVRAAIIAQMFGVDEHIDEYSD